MAETKGQAEQTLKTYRKAYQKAYRLVSKDDPNVYEDLEGESYLKALEEALDCLGWFITVSEEEDTDEMEPETSMTSLPPSAGMKIS